MAHFAKIDENNIVQSVIVISNDLLLDSNGIEQESLGSTFCTENFGGTWIQTSYNGSIRKNYAATNYTYNEEIDAFVPPKIFKSWILNADKADYEAPITKPNDGQMYKWNEEFQVWELTE